MNGAAIRALSGLLFVVTVVAGVTPAAEADAALDPKAFIQDLGSEAIEVLSNGGLNADQREREFRRLFVKNFDVPRIGQFVLGRFWRTATESQRREYLQLFQDFVIKAYASRLQQYSGETLTVKDSRSENDGESVVHTIIESPAGGPPTRVDWRVRRDDGGFKIIDVVVEGVSMAITHRSEFASVIQNGGGRVDALLDALRKRSGAR